MTDEAIVCDVCHGRKTVPHEGDDYVCPECDGTGTEDPAWRAHVGPPRPDKATCKMFPGENVPCGCAPKSPGHWCAHSLQRHHERQRSSDATPGDPTVRHVVSWMRDVSAKPTCARVGR